MALLPEDARAELDREDLQQARADMTRQAVEVPDDVKAELDAETRKMIEEQGDDALRPVALDDEEAA